MHSFNIKKTYDLLIYVKKDFCRSQYNSATLKQGIGVEKNF